jgi:DNA replication licensing factor MCM5
MNFLIRSHVATEADVIEAVNLFKVSTVEAAQSGINQQVTLTPEIKVCQ